jgi:alanyl-tRNA synthetase
MTINFKFKNILIGKQDPKYTRVANSQKCIRVGGKHNDLNVVGTDSYHHTFFEMLGNWSFGDYFKKEACGMEWELLTKVYKIPPERLYVTFFKGDGRLNLPADIECKEIWRSLGVPENRIIGFGLKENFWEMGATGPCGGCSEIHIDHLPSFNELNRATDVNQDKSDLTEIWNIVFIEYFRNADGTITKLPKKHVDTGMGFERLVAFLQGKQSNYDSDLFTPIFDSIHKTTRVTKYSGSFIGANSEIDTAYRIIADHSRMAAIALADGMFPEQK